MSLSEKAKTSAELNPKGKEEYCRDCYEEEVECPNCFWNREKWVRLEDHQHDIGERDLTITALRNTLERERGLLKQSCGEIRSKLKFLDYEQYHGDLKQSLNPTLREINQLITELLR